MPGNHGENYVLIGVSGDACVTLLAEKMTDGSRAVIVFSDEVGAETFRIVEKRGPRVQIVADAHQEVARLLEAAAATGGARYVAIDPPTSLTCGNVDSRLAPLSGFLDRLLGEQSLSKRDKPGPGRSLP